MTTHAHQNLRAALASVIGKQLTPEIATFIELYVFGSSNTPHNPGRFGVKAYKNIEFRCERFADIAEELRNLHEEHYAETEIYRSSIPLSPNYDEIIALERSGSALQFTARESGSNELVGNILISLFVDTWTNVLCAADLDIFVSPRCRKGFMAAKFFGFVEESLASLGVKEIRIGTKTINRSGKLFEYLGYEHVANMYSKVFGD